MEAKKQVVIASSPSQRRTREKGNHQVQEEILYDVVEEILSRVPVKSLLRFKSVSKQWRSTIDSFMERQLKIAERYHLEVLVATVGRQCLNFSFTKTFLDSTSSLNHLKFPHGTTQSEVSNSCDGLVCIFDAMIPSMYVVNPATRWFRQLPPARFQLLMSKAVYTPETRFDIKPTPLLAFAKAGASRGYKLVWLYNSDRFNSDAFSPNKGFTKCEVFDFRANEWRYLTCTPSYHIYDDQRPAYVNGKLYWLTEQQHNGETKVIVLDLKTETFEMMSSNKNPAADSHPDHIDMCSLENRLCMSKRKRKKMIQEIWMLQTSSSSEQEDAWEKIYTIDLRSCCSWAKHGIGFSWTREGVVRPCTPVTVYKNKKILFFA